MRLNLTINGIIQLIGSLFSFLVVKEIMMHPAMNDIYNLKKCAKNPAQNSGYNEGQNGTLPQFRASSVSLSWKRMKAGQANWSTSPLLSHTHILFYLGFLLLASRSLHCEGGPGVLLLNTDLSISTTLCPWLEHSKDYSKHFREKQGINKEKLKNTNILADTDLVSHHPDLSPLLPTPNLRESPQGGGGRGSPPSHT